VPLVVQDINFLVLKEVIRNDCLKMYVCHNEFLTEEFL